MINWVGVGPSNVHEVVTHVVVSELSRVQDLTAAAAAAAAAATASVRGRRTIVVAKEQSVVKTLTPGVGVDAHHLPRLSLVKMIISAVFSCPKKLELHDCMFHEGLLLALFVCPVCLVEESFTHV